MSENKHINFEEIASQNHTNTDFHTEQRKRQAEGAKALGVGGGNTYRDEYSPQDLEAIPNVFKSHDYIVSMDAQEFTSRCAKTGQADFATISISYIPDEKLVESKSLKTYLGSFRNEMSFHETCIGMMMEDLIKLLDPKYIEVFGNFTPRGGICILPFMNYAKEGSGYEQKAQDRKFEMAFRSTNLH